jgi:hypothetical protein
MNSALKSSALALEAATDISVAARAAEMSVPKSSIGGGHLVKEG